MRYSGEPGEGCGAGVSDLRGDRGLVHPALVGAVGEADVAGLAPGAAPGVLHDQ